MQLFEFWIFYSQNRKIRQISILFTQIRIKNSIKILQIKREALELLDDVCGLGPNLLVRITDEHSQDLVQLGAPRILQWIAAEATKKAQQFDRTIADQGVAVLEQLFEVHDVAEDHRFD